MVLINCMFVNEVVGQIKNTVLVSSVEMYRQRERERERE